MEIEAFREEAWNQGFAAGYSRADAELAPLRLQLAAAAGALNRACSIDPDGLRPVLTGLVRQVAEAVLGAELRGGAKVLLPLVEAALAAVRLGEAAVLRGHPAVVAGLELDMAVEGDESLAMDGFVVSGMDFIVDVSLAARLDEIMGQIL